MRAIIPARDDLRSLYVHEQGATVRKKDAVIQVAAPKTGQSLAEIRLVELSQVCLFGNVQVTTQALQALRENDIPVV